MIRAILFVLWVEILMAWHRPPKNRDVEMWGR